MESSMLSTLVFMSFFFLFTLAQPHPFNASLLSKCHEKERFALFEFKATYYNTSCDYKLGSKHGLKSWTMEGENGDCCNWDGVECDKYSGYVIGLDLSFLGLYFNCLSGSINSSSSIFKLVHLERLHLSANTFLTLTSLRELVQTLVKLKELNLIQVNISSSIPESISRLSSLKSLALCDCGLQGHIPPSIANLVSLESLELSENHLEGEIPCLQNLTKLKDLDLRENNLVGDISTSSFWNLAQLQSLFLSSNKFTGEIFPQLQSCTKLRLVGLSSNKLYGQIPRTISLPKNLTCLSLDSNNFSGKIYMDVFYELEHLEELNLSYNNFSQIVEPTIKPHYQLLSLSLASCSLGSLPKFLSDQENLNYIDLSYNDIIGEVPEWFFDVGKRSLAYLNLSHNHLTGFGGNLPFLKWDLLFTLDLGFNQLKGSLPTIPINTTPNYYLVSNNEFSGEIPTWMCNLELEVLDLSNNNLSGQVPPCFTDLVSNGHLTHLSLRSNNFTGRIPQLGKGKCNLVMIDMSYNQLEGSIPKGIENCINLEFLNLGNNRIYDVFPVWLGKLPSLSVLILDSNRFHGVIEGPKVDHHFLKLQIISLSRNKFIGSLPSHYFLSWRAMKVDANEKSQLQYWEAPIVDFNLESYYYSFQVDSKGIRMDYKKIQKSLVMIDLSSNNFTGEIPKSIGTLKRLYSLNLSHNMLIGSIPFNLNGLINLESLDLSHNKLFGEIPQQLTDLNSLSFFDVSFNNLTGPIPTAKQFNTFEASSYQGNSGLCGLLLSKMCENTTGVSPLPPLVKDHASKTWIEINWKIISMGYASGFVIGMTIGMSWTRGCKRVGRVRQIKFILN